MYQLIYKLPLSENEISLEEKILTLRDLVEYSPTTSLQMYWLGRIISANKVLDLSKNV